MSAVRFNCYDDWRNALLTCPVCGWQGRWEQAEVNHHSQLQRETRLESFERDKLKTVEQLPDLPDADCEFIWDITEDEHDKFQEIRIGKRLIWRELAFWENGTRFGEIEELLKQKYGARFRSLPPPPGSELWLRGDKFR